MRCLIKYIEILLCLFLFHQSWAQNLPKTICRIEDGSIIFQINLNWNREQRNEVIKQYDIDSVALANVYEGLTRFTVHGETWNVLRITPQMVEMSKVLDEQPASSANKNDGILMLASRDEIPNSTGAEFADYGVNRFDLKTAFQYEEGVSIFYLPNHEDAKRVYLSGSFNGWSTIQTPMHKNDSGWVATIKLQPGKYKYKFIIDGHWKYDRNNLIKERDGDWGYYSIVYCYNYRFELKGERNASRVIVAGSFNNWSFNELQMNKTAEGWELPLFLREGTHAYKFIVDGKWISDPSNKVTHPDGRGNVNSFIGVGDEHLFKLQGYPNANRVCLAGDFNAWNQNELEMEKVKDGWQISYSLGSGNYEYKFIVDGKWIADPQNLYATSSNSFLAFKANHIFTLDNYSNADIVIVTGSFNGWRRDGYRMAKKNGEWIFPIYLKPGKYTYKFIVDKQWILDPNNRLWDENEFGTGNSVLWVEP